ncbi:MAG: hypothetical protein ACOYMG_19560, partial [Candidatus Methylumidiphilus sp.]
IIAQDTDGAKGLLIPIIVLPNPQIPKLLQSFRGIDLSGCKDESEAIRLLLDGVSLERHKPNRKPPYWGSGEKPIFWGEAESDGAEGNKPSQRQATSPPKKPLPSEFRLGLLDKKNQAKHIAAQVPKEHKGCKHRAWAFLLTGLTQEWPQSIGYKLAYVAEKDLKVTNDRAADVIPLRAEKLIHSQVKPDEYLWELVGEELNCQADPTAIKNVLEAKKVCQVMCRDLSSDESANHDLLAKMLEAWSKLQLAEHSPSHFLLFIRVTELDEKPERALFFKRRTTWVEKMYDTLARYGHDHCLLPPLETPTWESDIHDWLKRHVKEELRGPLKSEIAKVYGKATAIPHGDIKEIWLPLLESLEVTTKQG